MPAIARKVIVCAAIDGLIIQPLSSKGQKPFQPVRLKYGDASVSSVSRDQVPDTSTPGASFEAFGVIGLLTVSRLSYLVTITRRQQVAQICGSPIYVVTEVAVTPCSSKVDADESIQKTAHQLERQGHEPSEESESSDDEVELPPKVADEVEDAIEDGDAPIVDKRKSSVAEDVMRRRGSYGVFAQRWFSKVGWALDQKRTMGLGNSPEAKDAAKSIPQPEITKVPSDEDGQETPDGSSSLLPKLLRAAQVFFGTSESFYFSYDFDITRSLVKRTTTPTVDDVPLHNQVENVFFWNRHLLEPLTSADQSALALPLMQGFVGQRSFIVDSQPPQVDDTTNDSLEMRPMSPAPSAPGSPPGEAVRGSIDLRDSERRYLVTVISRRSTKRAGLRYLRRGIDEDGFVANMVETEQLLSTPGWEPSSNVHSFLQVRGSIPLFFTQSPYSLKPVPVLQHSEEANHIACKEHFDKLLRNYGSLQIVNLVEKNGIEKLIGEAYESNVKKLNAEANEDQQIPFEWFDFHAACRGMKFENVSHLLATLRVRLDELGSTVAVNGEVQTRQQGVLRTNCMDCLDRTNVCQSSFARHMLESQLKQEGIDMSAQADKETPWFNTLWADNGDAVSKQYASTAAMKGDYTRTRKRDYRGALNDLGLSIARFYSGMVNDYFSQAAIDFLLGNVTAKVFEEFETDMMTKDPAISVSRMRQQAIELCQKRVVADESEDFHGGWVLLSPSTPDSIRAWPLEEVVLLLTDVALYRCQFDWKFDKVSSFERVELSSVTGIQLGTYITSTISGAHMDETGNVGFVISYQPGRKDIRRTNTRTMSSVGEVPTRSRASTEDNSSLPASLVTLLSSKPKSPTSRMLVFKAPYTSSSALLVADKPQQTEKQQVVDIYAEVKRTVFERQPINPDKERTSIMEEKEIISLEDAKKNTGLLEQLGHSLKKMVWA